MSNRSSMSNSTRTTRGSIVINKDLRSHNNQRSHDMQRSQSAREVPSKRLGMTRNSSIRNSSSP